MTRSRPSSTGGPDCRTRSGRPRSAPRRRPSGAAASGAPGRRRAEPVESSWSMRPAAADDRAAWAICMPAIRSGKRRIEDVGVEGDELADLELAVEDQVAAVGEDDDEREGGQEVDERQEVRPRAARPARARSRTWSASFPSWPIWRVSVPNPFTTRTPATVSSTTPERSPSSSWSWSDTGCSFWEKRAAPRLRSGSAPRENTVSKTLLWTITTRPRRRGTRWPR